MKQEEGEGGRKAHHIACGNGVEVAVLLGDHNRSTQRALLLPGPETPPNLHRRGRIQHDGSVQHGAGQRHGRDEEERRRGFPERRRGVRGTMLRVSREAAE